MATSRAQIMLRLPLELLAQIDEQAQAAGLSRNEWYIRMTKWALEHASDTDTKGQTHDVASDT